MTLVQLGEVASSKSAIHTFAPELSALMLILRLGGPVISARRSSRPGAGGATRQPVSLRTSAVVVRKSTDSPAEMRLPRSRRAASSSARRPEWAPSSLATNASASGVRISSKRGCIEPLILGSFGGSNMTCLLLRRTAVTTWLGRWGGTARANLLTGPRDNYPGREASRAELSQW